MNNQLHFELLCFDLDNKCPFGADVNKFASILNGNTKLFSSSASITANTIKDKNLQVSITLIEGNSNVDYKSAFLINVLFSNQIESNIDKFRFELVQYLVTLQFGKIYISKDDFSRKLLNNLYPMINELENLLRSYITKHISIKEGVAYWFTRSINNEAKNKVDKRKRNENLFSTLSKSDSNIVDTQISLIDFEDLGDIIYSNSFGNQNISDLVDNILKSEDIDKLKSSVQRNSDKYFQSFKDVGFQDKWSFLKNIRHKVAHNGFINCEESEKAKNYIVELTEFVGKLEKEIVQVDFSAADIDRGLYNESGYHFRDITKNELLRELKSYKEWGDSIGRDFLGLKNFLHNRLGGSEKGYHIGKAWDRLEELEKDGYIKIDMWKDPTHKFPDQKEILILRELPVYTA